MSKKKKLALSIIATITIVLYAFVTRKKKQPIQPGEIGKSRQGRAITSSIYESTTEPGKKSAFLIVSNIHGDEDVGYQIMQRFKEDIPEKDYTIIIIDSVNPDGLAKKIRYFANGNDPNRSFHYDFATKEDIRNNDDDVEVVCIKDYVTKLQDTYTIFFAVTFHGGALVVSYPYDQNPNGEDEYSVCKDDAFYKQASLEYIRGNPKEMKEEYTENGDGGYVNGADWYTMKGSLQDWLYDVKNINNFTVELDNVKKADAETIEAKYANHRGAIIRLMDFTFAN